VQSLDVMQSTIESGPHLLLLSIASHRIEPNSNRLLIQRRIPIESMPILILIPLPFSSASSPPFYPAHYYKPKILRPFPMDIALI
jgi:hypothetical protein